MSAWPKVAFGDVVRKVTDRVEARESGLRRYVAGEHMVTNDSRIRRWGTIGDDYLGPAFHMRFRPGHVLYGSRRTYLRKVAVPDFEGITANTTFVLEPRDPSILLPDLLPFIMQTESFHEHSITQSKGSVNPYVNFSDLACYEFVLPPLREQRRMAVVLSCVERAAEAVRSAIEAMRSLRMAHLNSFLEPRLRRAVPLGEAAKIVAGSTPPKGKTQLWGGKRRWASGKDLKTRRLEDTAETLTDQGWRMATVAPRGSTLIVVRGMILAHSFPVAQCVRPTAINQDLRALIARRSFNRDYLFLWTEWSARWFLRRVSISSHGTKRIEGDIVKVAPVPLATEEEQKTLVSQGQAISQGEERLLNRHLEFVELRNSILSRLLDR